MCDAKAILKDQDLSMCVCVCVCVFKMLGCLGFGLRGLFRSQKWRLTFYKTRKPISKSPVSTSIWRFKGCASSHSQHACKLPEFLFLQLLFLNPDPNRNERWPSGASKLPDLWARSARRRPRDENIAWRPRAGSQGVSWPKTTIRVALSPDETSALCCLWGLIMSVIYDINLRIAVEPNVNACGNKIKPSIIWSLKKSLILCRKSSSLFS